MYYIHIILIYTYAIFVCLFVCLYLSFIFGDFGGVLAFFGFFPGRLPRAEGNQNGLEGLLNGAKGPQNGLEGPQNGAEGS